MDALGCLSLALLLHQAMCAGDGKEVTSAVGRSVTFHLRSPGGNAAAWSFRDEIIATVKFGSPPEAVFFDDSYKSRLAFPENGNALTIVQLRVGDAGTYTAKVAGVKITFTLHVYTELTAPTVTCAARNCSADSCRYTLHCDASGSGSGNVSYSWSTGRKLLSEGPELLVEESSPDEPPLTCEARNPVSSSNATVSPAALCAGSSRQAGIVAASVIGAGVLVAVIIFAIYSKSRGWRIFCLPAAEAVNTGADADYTTVYAEVGPSEQSFSNAQRGDPKRTPTSGVETSKTIYSTIQATAQMAAEKMGEGTPGCWELDEKSPYLSVS
ncbi:SLAM family member 7-like isoform X2 [Opisthocomus hoazin]|uniref:SLAM family member 7-like isoform X2 n=1 Tax=Opisthocomus hoazin TaxID=30419 RepID=UPI003F52B2E8